MKKLALEKLKIQADFCNESENVLDIGFSANPNPYISGLIGIDIALPDEAPKNYSKIVKCNLNIEKIPFGNDFFGSVVAGDIIEHVENPSFFLREVNRVLKKKGVLIISTPQANDWWTTAHNWFFRGVVNDPDSGEHLQNWTILDMKRLLKKNGFKLKKIEGFYMRFPRIKFKIRVKNFPVLSWQVFYVATKVSTPKKEILVKVSGKWQEV